MIKTTTINLRFFNHVFIKTKKKNNTLTVMDDQRDELKEKQMQETILTNGFVS
jgi:hypothetical protein